MTDLTFHPRPSIPRCGRRRRLSGRAFTLMELVMGMIITGLVMVAVSALLSAVAHGWTQTTATQSSSNHKVQVHARVQSILKGAKQLGAVRPGSLSGYAIPAAVMMWAGDYNGDDRVQFSELALLMHDGGTGSPDGYLAFYEVVYPSAWTAAQKEAADSVTLSKDEIYKDSNIDTFRLLANVRQTILATEVVGATFTLTDGADVTRPSLDYVLKFQKAGSPQTEYGTVAVRTPTTLPASQH